MTARKETPLELRVDELKLLVDLTQTEGAFGAQEKAIVEEIINLPEVSIREVMVPRVEETFLEWGMDDSSRTRIRAGTCNGYHAGVR